MPLLNFQSRFAPLVESGQKRQTIRRQKNDGSDPKVGDRLELLEESGRKLGEAIATKVREVAIHRTDRGDALYLCGWKQWDGACEYVARADGFDSFASMVDWFTENYGLPFRGLLIEWGEIERGE